MNLFIIFTIFMNLNHCLCHISMSYPPSRKSRFNSYYVSRNDVNYNLRSPLNAQPDFFTFPCKGFGMGKPTTFFEDNKITITLEGTAIHGGGHCQFGISYDNKEFIVLKTVESNCLTDTMTYSFDLPDDARKGDMVVFWTWINKLGNREYYMECADVNVKGDSTKSSIIKGKELLVVNLPGYPQLPEGSMEENGYIYGIDLLNARKDKYLSIGNPTLPSTEEGHKVPVPKPILQPSYRRTLSKTDCNDKNMGENEKIEKKIENKNMGENEKIEIENCTTGEMKCSGNLTPSPLLLITGQSLLQMERRKFKFDI